MEDLWKRFKEETKDDMEKIGKFLEERSAAGILKKNPNPFEPQRIEKIEQSIAQQIVLDDENSKKDVSTKKNYGGLTSIVREIMEKEKISRAQAYRRAKKTLAEKSQ